MLSPSQTFLGRYSVAVILASIALLATIQIELVATQTPFALFFGAVVISAWILGRGPGFLSWILSAVGAQLVLVPYLQNAQFNSPKEFQFGSFLVAGSFLVWLTSSFRKYVSREVETENDYRSLLAATPFPALISDSSSGKFLSVNRAAIEVYGYTEEEFLNLCIKDVILADATGQSSAANGKVGGAGPINVSKHRRKDGSSLYVELSVQDLPGTSNARLYYSVDVTERVRTSEALRKNEEKLEKVFGSCPVSMSVHRWSDRAFVDVNPEFAELTGWDLAEVFGRTPSDCGLLTQAVEDQIVNQLKGRTTISDYEIEITTRRGKKRRVLVGAVFAEVDGDRLIIVSVLDVTELRRAEQRNFDVEKRLRLVTEKARVGLVMINDRRRFSFVNSEYAEIFGLPTANITGRRVAEVHPDLYENQIEPSLDRVFAGHSLNFELRQKFAHGTRYFDVRCEPSKTDGEINSVVAVVTEITEKTLADLARDASEERYRTLFEYSPDGIAIADPDSHYLDANETLCKMLGYTLDELIGLHATNIFVPREVAHLGLTLFGRNSDLEYYQEWQYRRKDGSTFPGEVIATKMPDGNTLTVIRDITERKHLEDQLLQAQKMEAIGVLAGGVAHDFNNILTAISGYSELALQQMEADDPLREYLAEIGHAGDRAAALTKQLLSFSRRGQMTPTVNSLNDAINETQRMLKRIVKENINFRIDLAPDLKDVKVDSGRISQVIVNLVVNAGDAMPDGGTISISTRNTFLEGDVVHENVVVTSGQFVELTVRDTGIGMDQVTRRRLFEPFFTTKETGKGTGLGLSTVYGIVRESGGDILVQSEPGKGSTFRVYLPAATKAKERKPDANTSLNSAAHAATILLVEDESAVRNLVQSILVRKGYDVISVECGENALEICRISERKIDLLLTDMIMPGMNGAALKQKIEELRPGISTVIMSGYTGDLLEKTMLLDPTVSFIGKPFRSRGDREGSQYRSVRRNFSHRTHPRRIKSCRPLLNRN